MWRRTATRCLSAVVKELEGQTLVQHGTVTERKPGAFAIVKHGGTQHKVTKDDVIVAEKMRVEVGQEVVLDEVLLVGTVHETLVGHPLVPETRVVTLVEEITKDEKVIIFKKRRRKSSRRRNGFRRDITLLRVMDIIAPSLDIKH